MKIDLTGKTVIVTGAGRGIGKEIAGRFAKAGADIVVAARSQKEITTAVEDLTDSYGGDMLAVPTNLRQKKDIDGLVDKTIEEMGTPEILINNAGANFVKPPNECTDEEITRMLDVNLRGLFLLSQEFGEAHSNSDIESGRIINISSIAAVLGVPAMTLYGGTKAGVRSITRGFAADFAQYGITVNSVSPGLTRVKRTETVIEDNGEEVFDLERIPLGRLGKPRDTANACLFLASELANYITGEDILVDGGTAFTAGLYK